MTVFERIESLRKSQKISQGKLEKELGFSNGSISKWKTSMPKPERLQKVADYFGVTIDYLMTGEEKEDSPSYYLNEETAAVAQEIFDNPDLRLLFDASRNATPEDLRTARDVLLALKRKEHNWDNEGC